jgi:hypothetical protein
MPSPSQSENGVANVTSHALPRLRSVTEQLKSEENGLTTFLKRCNARNFSVKVRGTDIGKEPTSKVKGSEHILTLEPIAEGAVKVGGSKVNRIVHDGKLPDPISHDTNMMLYGANTLTRDMDVESVDYETTIHTDAVANLSPDKAGHTISEAAGIEPTKIKSLYNKAVEFRAASVAGTNVDPAAKPIKVDLAQVEPANLKLPESEPSNDGITKIKLVDANVTNGKERNQNSDQWDYAIAHQNPAAEIAEEVKTNAWGKPMKPDPTRNKEGSVVGGSTKPIGSENRGRAMMEKMGWSRGTGLGKEKGGILEPITHVVKNTKAGLRSSDEKKSKSGFNTTAVPAENNPNSTPGKCFLTLPCLKLLGH